MQGVSTAEAVPESVPPLEQAAGEDAALFILEYADGFRATLLHCQGPGNVVAGWAYAARITGLDAPVATAFNGNEAPNCEYFPLLYC